MNLHSTVSRKIGRKLFDLLGINRSVFFSYQFQDCFLAQKRLVNMSNPTIFDIGSFDGRTAKAYAKYFSDATIHSFEPFPESFKRLQTNKLRQNHILNNCAVSDKNGEATFYVNAYKATNSLLPSSAYGEKINPSQHTESTIVVPQITLDHYCTVNNVNNIDILKLDVQGAEMKVLEGAKNLLSNQKIQVIFSEVEFRQIYENQALYEELATFLNQYQFSFFSFYNLSYARDGQMLYGDAIFIRNK